MLKFIKLILIQEKESYILWIPIIFSVGIFAYFKYSSDVSYVQILTVIITNFLSIYLFKGKNIQIFLIIAIIFILGFLWIKFYSEKMIQTKITQKNIYTNVTGEIEQIKYYENNNFSVILKNLRIAKPSIKKNKKYSIKKDSNKKIIRDYFNLEGYQNIDKNLIDKKYYEISEFKKYKKIKLYHRSKNNSKRQYVESDIINSNVFIKPFNKPFFNTKHYPVRDSYFNKISAFGYIIHNPKIIGNSQNSSQINKLRNKIENQIVKNSAKNDEKNVILSLIIGKRDELSKDLMDAIRKSGLAHLMAISGLHIGLVTSFFYFFTRLILSRVELLVLKYDIKKMSVLLALVIGLIYTLISGSSISAIRALIMIFVFSISVFLDRQFHILRSVTIAALVILIFNPYNLFSISFQLSYIAVLSLASTYQQINKISFKNKILEYFLLIIFSSFIAQIATLPFLIYYFNHFPTYGIISNLIAVPLVSFVILPIGFLSLPLMLIGFEYYPLQIVNFASTILISVAYYFSSLPYSSINISISYANFIISIFSLLSFLLLKTKLRFVGIIFFILTIVISFIRGPKLPNLYLNEKRKYFILYDKEYGVVSSKNIISKMEVDKIKREYMTKEIINLKDKEKDINFSSKNKCLDSYCKIIIKNYRILVLTKRNKNKFICKIDTDILINFTKKYKLPSCINRKEIKIIDNTDLENKGDHLLFFHKDKLKIQNIKNKLGRIF